MDELQANLQAHCQPAALFPANAAQCVTVLASAASCADMPRWTSLLCPLLKGGSPELVSFALQQASSMAGLFSKPTCLCHDNDVDNHESLLVDTGMTQNDATDSKPRKLASFST